MCLGQKEGSQRTGGVQIRTLRAVNHWATMPPSPLCQHHWSVQSLQPLDRLQVFVHVCLCKWLRGSRFRGGSVGRWARYLTQINTCTRAPRLLEHGADILLLPELYCVGVYIAARVLRVRWQMALICLTVCMGDNWLIRKMSQTVNDEIWNLQTVTPLSH